MDDKLWLNASLSRNIDTSLSHREKYINKKKQDIEKITRRNRSYSLPDIYPRNFKKPKEKIEKKELEKVTKRNRSYSLHNKSYNE